ncbi:unnamed protein product [Ectocarpus sp. 12 AP-2014]
MLNSDQSTKVKASSTTPDTTSLEHRDKATSLQCKRLGLLEERPNAVAESPTKETSSPPAATMVPISRYQPPLAQGFRQLRVRGSSLDRITGCLRYSPPSSRSPAVPLRHRLSGVSRACQ